MTTTNSVSVTLLQRYSTRWTWETATINEEANEEEYGRQKMKDLQQTMLLIGRRRCGIGKEYTKWGGGDSKNTSCIGCPLRRGLH